MFRNLLFSLSVLASAGAGVSCKETPSNPGVLLPSNLVTKMTISSTIKGKVEAEIKADNANFYSIHFETQAGFVSPEMSGNKAHYTYVDTGWFKIKFRAHVSNASFTEKVDSVYISFPESTLENGYKTPLSYPGYRLVWADEFEGNSLDMNAWTYETGRGNWGWGNNELQYYQDGTKNAVVADGKLTITAKKEAAGTAEYTSARIKTQGKKAFTFGRVDIRARLPKGQGVWPALWMLGSNITQVGWPACGEIDIMELVGHKPNEIFGTAHWGNSAPSTYLSKVSRLSAGDYSDSFNVFSIIWSENKIEWFMNDVRYHIVTPANTGGIYPFNKEHFFIFNVAIGGTWPGNPDATTRLPQSMEVDYIRVFQPN
jgi:beta-glucanase (GH16 family)